MTDYCFLDFIYLTLAEIYSKLLILLRMLKMMVWKTVNSRTTGFQHFEIMLEFFAHRSELFGHILFTLLLFGKNTQTSAPLAMLFICIPFETLESCNTEGQNRGAKKCSKVMAMTLQIDGDNFC